MKYCLMLKKTCNHKNTILGRLQYQYLNKIKVYPKKKQMFYLQFIMYNREIETLEITRVEYSIILLKMYIYTQMKVFLHLHLILN